MNPKKILVVMLRRIGDVILTTPVVRALKVRYPQAHIDFIVEPPADEVLEGNSDISRVWVYRPGAGLSGWPVINDLAWMRAIRAQGYDWAIDFMGGPRSAMLTFASGAPLRAGPGHVGHRWAYNRRMLQSPQTTYTALEKIRALGTIGIPLSEKDVLPRWDLDSLYDGQARIRFEALGLTKKVIGLAPASRRKTRAYPAQSYAAVGKLLAEKHDAQILVFWGPGEKELAESIVRTIGDRARVAPETRSLKELGGLIRRTALLLTNCNGPKHLAVALGRPTVTIHGSSDPAAWNPPHAPLHAVARKDDLHCIGCRLNDCPYQLECMTQLAPETVAALANAVLDTALGGITR